MYAETSAVLAWLFHEEPDQPVREALATASKVVTSRLTLIECGRAIASSRARGRFDDAAALTLHQRLERLAENWAVMDLVGELTERAALTFPIEPVRTLDALHLAAALVYHQALGQVTVLSLDRRIRANATALGLPLAPLIAA